MSALLLPGPSRAAEPAPPLPTRLGLSPGVPPGAGRDLALGGASVGIAEGAGGFATNLAALAHRSPDLARDWDIGVHLVSRRVPLSAPRHQDLDNDGAPDDAQHTTQLAAGVLLQFHALGFGMAFRTDTTGYCASAACLPEELVEASVTNATLAAGVGLFGDSLLVAAGVYATDVTFRAGGQQARYGGHGPAVDLLWRPAERPFRVGVAYRPGVLAQPREGTGTGGTLAGRPLHAAVVAPATLSLGASMRLGEGAHRYNRLSPAARADLGLGPAPVGESGPDGRWLLALQLDVVPPVEDAVPLRSFTAGQPAEPVGRELLLLPRVGVEHELLPGMLRARTGFFLEPSAFADRAPRAHLTGGVELFLLRYVESWAISASFDVAPRYVDFGIGIGFWR